MARMQRTVRLVRKRLPPAAAFAAQLRGTDLLPRRRQTPGEKSQACDVWLPSSTSSRALKRRQSLSRACLQRAGEIFVGARGCTAGDLLARRLHSSMEIGAA